MPAANDPLSLIFQALADPTRRGIVERLSRGSATVGELAEPYDVSRSAISQHLAVLERAGLIERTTAAQWRRCTLRPESLDAAHSWVAQHRAAWDDRFDRLEATLARLTDDPGNDTEGVRS